MRAVELDQLFQVLWRDYATITPQAERVHKLLSARGERVENDHIALRTYALPEVEMEVLDRVFVANDYEPADSYEFPDKKLFAYHYQHPDPSRPKVFLSELHVDELSSRAQDIIRKLVAQVPPGKPLEPGFVAAGRPWNVSYREYETLAAESEYAAWVAAFGFRANHFTISVNALKTFEDLGALNRFLKESGFALNQSGGEIKGSPEVFLEQSSTLADAVDVNFSDGTHRIPSCYYEFARRYRLPNGELYQGFVATSADRIFESTDRR